MLIASASTLVFAADRRDAAWRRCAAQRSGGSKCFCDFLGDLVETRAGSIANLNSLGSSVIILPASLVEFQGQSLLVEHGIRVATSHGFSVHVGCMTVVPVSSAWTKFEVTDVNGTVEVVARENNLRLEMSAGSGTSKELSASRSSSDLREGEKTSRDESAGCKSDKRRKNAGATPAGRGGILNTNRARHRSDRYRRSRRLARDAT